jgi:hypothetical protein
MRGLLNQTNNTHTYNNMKPIITMASGAMLRAISTPIAITGRSAQGLAKGGMRACMAIDKFGRVAELKGLKMADESVSKVEAANWSMSYTRSERKLQRLEAKKLKVEQAIAERRTRIAELEMQLQVTKITEQLSKSGMNEVLKKAQETWGMPSDLVPQPS